MSKKHQNLSNVTQKKATTLHQKRNRRKPVGSAYNKTTMKSLVNPPSPLPWYFKPFIKIADKKAHKKMLMGRVLTWSPHIAISSALLELYIEKGASRSLEKRMVTLIRMMVSYTVPSPFAIDINTYQYKKYHITKEEIEGIRGLKPLEHITSLHEKERVALHYAQALSKTPLVVQQSQLDDLRRLFSEKEIIAITTLTAKVNYWARLFEALRIAPAGLSDDPVLHQKEYETLLQEERPK